MQIKINSLGYDLLIYGSLTLNLIRYLYISFITISNPNQIKLYLFMIDSETHAI